MIATPTEPVTIYYCKAGIPTGQTVRVTQLNQPTVSCSGVHLHGVTATMLHGNSRGKAKASGARCVLQIHSGNITIIP